MMAGDRCAAALCSALVLLFSACDTAPSDPRTDDKPTHGHVTILVDEGLQSVFEDVETVFEGLYKDAEVDLRYLPEGELLKAMLHDSVRAVFASFRPGSEQDEYLRSKQTRPHVEVVATDAVAIVTNKQAGPDSITVAQLRSWLRNEPLPGEGGEVFPPYKMLFDGSGSSVARSLVDSLLGGDVAALKAPVFAAEGIDSLVARVDRDKNAIGFLPFAAISDLDNAACRRLRDQVKLVSVSNGSRAVPPTQGTLADGAYPLRRPVLMMVVEGKSGLGTGFASFVAGPKGQRIILKRGLVPAHIPARDVQMVFE